jgi:hypothetical protein
MDFDCNFDPGLAEEWALIYLQLNFKKMLSKSAMGNLRPAGRMRLFKLFSVALLKPLKYHYFIEKSTKSIGKVSILALDMAV